MQAASAGTYKDQVDCKGPEAVLEAVSEVRLEKYYARSFLCDLAFDVNTVNSHVSDESKFV